MNDAIVESPLPKDIHLPIGLDFPSAMREVIDGKKITRPTWPKGEYGFFNDGFLRINKDNVSYKWNVNDGDLFAKDWIIYES